MPRARGKITVDLSCSWYILCWLKFSLCIYLFAYPTPKKTIHEALANLANWASKHEKSAFSFIVKFLTWLRSFKTNTFLVESVSKKDRSVWLSLEQLRLRKHASCFATLHSNAQRCNISKYDLVSEDNAAMRWRRSQKKVCTPYAAVVMCSLWY